VDWIIGDDLLFRKQDLKPNAISSSIAAHLQENQEISFYLRGSILESEQPHVNADIDLYILHNDKKIELNFISYLLDELSIYKRYIDLHIIELKKLDKDIPNRLLLYCRSLHLKGPKIIFSPVYADASMLVSHWYAYNPEFAPDIMFSSIRSRVCALKNLTRCFGLLSLYKRGVFTRDIQECLSYAKYLDDGIGRELEFNWNQVEIRQPLFLKNIKRFLVVTGKPISC
jgi:hypothetical protein